MSRKRAVAAPKLGMWCNASHHMAADRTRMVVKCRTGCFVYCCDIAAAEFFDGCREIEMDGVAKNGLVIAQVRQSKPVRAPLSSPRRAHAQA